MDDLQRTLRCEESDDFNYSWMEKLGESTAAKISAFSQIETLEGLSIKERHGLQSFLELSLKDDPKERQLFLGGLFYQYGEIRVPDQTRSSDGPNIREIAPDFYTLVEGSYAALFQVNTVCGNNRYFIDYG